MVKLIHEYTQDIKRLCDALDENKLNEAIERIAEAYRNGKHVFVAGNGGSAATANHFSCDLSKNAIKGDQNRVKLITLSSNVEYITAAGNDIGFDDIFTEQLKNLMEDGDLIILISASGNSPDIVGAARYAKSRNGVIVGFTGFSGGALKALSDVCVHIDIDSYEKVEDMHMMLTHIIVCGFKSMFG